MQLRTGTASVTNGSAIITASAGNDWSGAFVGGLFSLTGAGAVAYPIAAVRAPEVNVSGRWELSLAVPYAGATADAQAYQITVNFTPNLGLPIPGYGDTAIAALLARAFGIIDANMLGVRPAFSAHYADATQDFDTGTAIVVFNVVEWNPLGVFAANKFTPGVQARFRLSGAVVFTGFAGLYVQIAVFKNNVLHRVVGGASASDSADRWVNWSLDVNALSEGDYFDVRVVNSEDNTATITAATWQGSIVP